MYLMETALGQYSQLGPMNVWKCAPVMFGKTICFFLWFVKKTFCIKIVLWNNDDILEYSMCFLFTGVGVGMVILSLMTSVYYNQLMAYTLYYMFGIYAHFGYDVSRTFFTI